MSSRSGWVVLCAALALPGTAAAERDFAWPDGRRAAVSLAYDDALPTHLDVAIPALDRYGLKGTFYLAMSAELVRTRMEDWREAARDGHELGNHSLFHQCSARGPGREWVRPEQDLDATTVAQMRAQVLLGNAILHAIDGSTEHTFTAPCGEAVAQDGNYVEAVADHFVGIKLVEGTVVADMATLDPAAVPMVAPVGFGADRLIALVEEAGRRGTMVNFTFHGIGGDYLETSREAHERLLEYLHEHRDVYWTDTFRNQMRWIRDRRGPGPD